MSAVLYVVMDGDQIVTKSGSSQHGPAIYRTRHNAERELGRQQSVGMYGRGRPDARVVEFIPRGSE